MQDRNPIVVRGLVAGALAATMLALWFLVMDSLAGRPFYTPAFLASALLGLDRVEPGIRMIAGYTLIHYAAFMALGVGVTWLLRKAEAVPGLLLGMVLGFLLFDIVFYAGVAVTGVDVVRELGWPNVLTGNLAAGVVLMVYLHLKGVTRAVSWYEVLREHRTLREGLLAGLSGAGAVALWFLAFDALSGRPLFTPAALGSAFFGGAAGVDEVQATLSVIGGYTLVHMAVFVFAGIVAAALASEVEHQPPLLLGAVLGFVTFEALFIGIIAIFASWVLDTLGWLSIASGNLVATLAMGGYLLRQHPVLRQEIRELAHHSYETPV